MSTPNINEAFIKPTGGYGRVFESMYTGSMMKAGLGVFAVWPYVISHMRGSPEHGALVELNPPLLAFMIGCEEGEIEKAIVKLCEADPNSRNKREDGRRLVKLGEFLYRVVNGAEYIRIRKQEANLVQHREAQKRYASKKRKGSGAGSGGKSASEMLQEKLVRDGDEEGALRVQEMADGVAPGTLGSYGPEAQAVMEAKNQENLREYRGLSNKSASNEASTMDNGAGAVPPPEDDMPDPDAVPVPEV